MENHMADSASNPATQPATNDQFYVCLLLPPRPSFAMDMTLEERQAMDAHVAYWTEHLGQGIAIVFGPAADPKGPWGLGVIRVKNDEQMRQLNSQDPAVLANIGLQYEVLPMLRAVV
jgi:hypothetical protein